MYIPQPVTVNLREGVVETAGGIRKMTVVFMELLDVDIAVSDDKDTLHEVGPWRRHARVPLRQDLPFQAAFSFCRRETHPCLRQP